MSLRGKGADRQVPCWDCPPSSPARPPIHRLAPPLPLSLPPHNFLPSPLSLGSRLETRGLFFFFLPPVTGGDVEEKAADQQEQTLTQEELGSVSQPQRVMMRIQR